MFAYGAVPAFAATGRPPFGEGAVPTIIHRTLHEEPDLRGVPASLAQLVAACLSRDPDRRPSAKLLPALLTARTATPGWLPFLLKGKGAFILDSPHLVALDARTGKRLWSADSPAPNTAPLVAAGGLICTGVAGTTGSGLYAWDAETGRIIWNYPLTTPASTKQWEFGTNGSILAAAHGNALLAFHLGRTHHDLRLTPGRGNLKIDASLVVRLPRI
ncbi:PQQ-binding-like beta-propeller repeat protein [Actinomadura sp. NAK00032]|uniref:outer membrane protein assembly factor BamB family protein n=1 Tax=Actinomadura sp. NAK00032 TaxID=2742128 RepID=UPI0015909B4D|nr:PQQ-binding-like beta-propeller repeat protein [Actinomadura sp. NAK00032]QKW36887.1 PQQ-binding-like beta-propeller repeat protein [Actinomadura sp. NAK00032]